MKEVISLIKPLQKYVHEDNVLDLKMAEIESELKLLKELILDTQTDIVRLQKYNRKKEK